MVYTIDNMRREAGFTIIELVIAVAVAAIIMGVGVSRYSAFNAQQSFNNSVQKIAGCIQQAQQYAVSPPADVDNVSGQHVCRARAAISSSSDGTTTSCYISLNISSSGSCPGTQFVTRDSLTVEDVGMVYSNGNLFSNKTINIDFGVLNRGAAVYDSFQDGFNDDDWTNNKLISFNLHQSNYSSGLTSKIIVPKMGVPIQIVSK